MIVVSDTTPLNYTVLIGAVDFLPKLFDQVYAPAAVPGELADPRTPATVREWARAVPAWLKVLAPAAILPSTARLGPGEAEAISLAKEIGAHAVLLDDKAGRRVALAEGLLVVRTLTLLQLAAEQQLIDLPTALQRLRATSFRIPQRLIDAQTASRVIRFFARATGLAALEAAAGHFPRQRLQWAR